MSDALDHTQEKTPAKRVVELSKLYLDVALNQEVGSDETRRAATDTVYALGELEQSRAALDHIRAYVLEAQTVLITRDDMHDHLKAQTFYDEAQGLYRLILSEVPQRDDAQGETP